MDQLPSSAVAVCLIGAVVAVASNSSTVTPATGAPLVSSTTVPPSDDEPAMASSSGQPRPGWPGCGPAADCPTIALNAMVMMVANTVTASSRLSSDNTPRLSRGFCSRVPVASGSSEASGFPAGCWARRQAARGRAGADPVPGSGSGAQADAEGPHHR